MRAFPILLAAFAATAWAGSAEAQARRGPRAARPAAAAPAGSGQRGSDLYSRPPGSTGTIYWNTPNASGNLGSPSTGGGGGGGA